MAGALMPNSATPVLGRSRSGDPARKSDCLDGEARAEMCRVDPFLGAAAMIQIESDSLLHVYREGVFTRALGRPKSRNPYPVQTFEHFLWEKGWRLIDVTPRKRKAEQSGMALEPICSPEAPPPSAVEWLGRLTLALALGAIIIWAAAYSSLIRQRGDFALFMSFSAP
jgi:hypothetical protein